jgi:iron complex transport system substrate-binding protein
MRRPSTLPRLGALALAIGVLVAACGERDEPTGELASPFPARVQDATGRAVTLVAPPERIVAVDTSAAMLVQALGMSERLVGVPDAADGIVPAAAAAVVASGGTIAVEEVAGAAPDLVIASEGVGETVVARLAEEAGSPVYVQPAETVDDVIRAALDLGQLAGTPLAARRLVNEIGDRIEAVASRVRPLAPVRVFVDTGFLTPPVEGSLIGDVVTRAGGELVPAGIGGAPLDASDVAAADPEVYVATSDSRVTIDLLAKDPDLRGTTAVRDGRLLILDAAALTQADLATIDTLEQLARTLHPDVFA